MDASESERPLRNVSRGEVLKHFAVYSGLRIALIALLWAVLYFAGVPGWPAAFVAVLISLPMSYFVLAGPRQRYVDAIVDRINWYRHEKARLDADLNPGD